MGLTTRKRSEPWEPWLDRKLALLDAHNQKVAEVIESDADLFPPNKPVIPLSRGIQNQVAPHVKKGVWIPGKDSLFFTVTGSHPSLPILNDLSRGHEGAYYVTVKLDKKALEGLVSRISERKKYQKKVRVGNENELLMFRRGVEALFLHDSEKGVAALASHDQRWVREFLKIAMVAQRMANH